MEIQEDSQLYKLTHEAMNAIVQFACVVFDVAIENLWISHLPRVSSSDANSSNSSSFTDSNDLTCDSKLCSPSTSLGHIPVYLDS